MSFRKEVIYSLSVFCLLAFISIIRQIWLKTQNYILNPVQAVIIFMVYLFCLNIWWKGIRKRVVSRSVKLYLTAEHWAMISGLMVRLGQSCITAGVLLYGRITGYFFLVPAILVAFFGFYAAYMLGKPRDGRLPVRLKLLLIPAVICVVLILTNDLHGLIFRQAEDDARAGVNAVFQPTVWFAVIFLMLGILEFAKIYLVFRHGRKIKNSLYRWLPTMVSFGFIIFTIPYAVTGFAVPKFELLEYYVGMIFLDCILWESLIAVGALPVNSHYREMFTNTTTGMLILRRDGSVYSCSEGMAELSGEQYEILKKEGMLIDSGGMEIHMSEINGGYVVWQRDTKELRDKLEELKDKKEELQSEDELLKAELSNRSEQEKINARKRLFDMVYERTRDDNEKILDLIAKMRSDSADRRQYMAEAVVLANKIKNVGIHILEETGGEPL